MRKSRLLGVYLCFLLVFPLFFTSFYGDSLWANLSLDLEKSINSSQVVLESSSSYTVEKAFPFLSFDRPVGIYHAGDQTDRLFVVEQKGVVQVFSNNENTSTTEVFLDIQSKVIYSGEMGLLGLAFHPNYSDNGYLYVDYTAAGSGDTIIERYTVDSGDPNKVDTTTQMPILEVIQPYTNHNGGQLVFGPDGYLYIAMGDGGGTGDPSGNGQNLANLLGSILRIDVDTPSGGLNYSIPNDNPFVDNLMGYKEEIFAYGLRNPWRFSFDSVTGWLWTGDVGQNRLEEIDIIDKGKNYGWNIMEGSLCYTIPGCNTTGLELPIWEYDHDEGRSVTGGFVYRGSRLTSLVGKYVYADYVNGRIWSLDYSDLDNPINMLLIDTDLKIPTFGVDEQNNLYLCAFDGSIYRVESHLSLITITSPVDQIYNIDSIWLNFTIDKNTSWIGYSLDGEPNITITGNTLVTSIPDGLHNVTMFANDTYGIMGSSITIYFQVKTQFIFELGLILVLSSSVVIIIVAYVSNKKRTK
jgi:hypothetical protein